MLKIELYFGDVVWWHCYFGDFFIFGDEMLWWIFYCEFL